MSGSAFVAAMRYAASHPSWPIGREKENGGGWYCPCRTVQLIERRPGERGPRYSVWTFFSNRRVDLRYPPIACQSRHHAYVTAYRRLEEAGGQPIVYPRSRALDLARSGDVVALECLR